MTTAAPQTVPAGVDSPPNPPGPGGHSSVESGTGHADPTVPAAAVNSSATVVGTPRSTCPDETEPLVLFLPCRRSAYRRFA